MRSVSLDMVASVDTSEWKARGHLHYLLKAIIKTKEMALHER